MREFVPVRTGEGGNLARPLLYARHEMLLRSGGRRRLGRRRGPRRHLERLVGESLAVFLVTLLHDRREQGSAAVAEIDRNLDRQSQPQGFVLGLGTFDNRSEERRVGKEGRSR